MKKKIGEVILQIIPVMIGVYLGFVVSNWSETNKTASQTELLRNNIIAEIKSNKSKIDEVLEYHTMIRDSSRFYKNIPNIEKMPSFFKGTRTITLTNSAFDTGIQTGLINNLKFEEIQAINNVYTMQSAYKDFNKLILSGLITIDFQENEIGIRKFYGYLAVSMTDVVIQENNLMRHYDKLLEKIEK
ncbi:MAG: hypothetical protein WA775_08745 [Psychroserpens sp.]|uniref:hypothetical protein n=1 Tax=Psychroserpens sp. TaxID=2020870 RepID=UPI003C773D50